jgi:biopolymer transport protein ExbD
MGKVAMEAKARAEAPPPPPRQVPMMMPGMMPGMMPMGIPMPGMPGIPNLTQPNTQLAPVRPSAPQAGEDDFASVVDNPPVEEEATETAPAEEAPAQEEAPAEEEQPVTTVSIASEAGLSLATQKRARKALRTLVRKLANSKEDDWYGHIAGAISNEMSIFHYVKAVTIRSALKESGSSDELNDRICDAMQKSGMIPEDVPYE